MVVFRDITTRDLCLKAKDDEIGRYNRLKYSPGVTNNGEKILEPLDTHQCFLGNHLGCPSCSPA